MDTYISIIFANKSDVQNNLNELLENTGITKARGKELLIYVPECGLPFSLNQLRSWISSPAKVDMFDLEYLPSGRCVRHWYEI